MRHRKSGRKLNRNSSHRQAMFRNMAVSLMQHEMIRTTLPKAKELRRVAEPLITIAKNDSVAKRRLAFARLRDRAVVTKLFNELGPRYKNRPGGYLRILKCGFRPGDKAPMHTHLYAHAVYIIEGGQLTLTHPDGTSKVIDAKPGDVMYMEAETHETVNTGTTVFRATVTEIK